LLRNSSAPTRAGRAGSWLGPLGYIGAVTGALFGAPNAQAAAPFYVALHYEVAASAQDCWDEAEFRQSVARAVGYDPFRSDAAMSVDVRISGSATLVDGRVEWRDAQGSRMGERHFVAKDGSCKNLFTELSFAVGLQVHLLTPKDSSESGPPPSTGDGSTTQPGAPASSAAASGTTTSKPPPAAKPPTSTNDFSGKNATTAPADNTRWQLWVGLGPSLAFGLSPSLTGQGRVFVGARRGHFSLELGAESTLPIVERQADGSGFRQLLLGGATSFCGHWQALSGCVLAKAQSLLIDGRGVDQPHATAAFVGQAGARIAATQGLSEMWLVTPHLDGVGLLTPRQVSLNGVVVWDMPPLAALAGIDVLARFR
jgi:hypothetical protein